MEDQNNGTSISASGSGTASGNARKRVRFQEETDVAAISSSHGRDTSSMPDAKRSLPQLGERGPAWPAGEGRARHVTACADDTMMAPDVAASKRAQMRSRMRGGREVDEDEGWEGLEGAEEDYDEPEELFNDAGIPIEPFHMRKEREEGYFDEDGNYIEYRLENVDDAWLDSLQQDDQGAIDAALAARLAVRGAAGLDEQVDGPPAMDSDDAAIYKRRVVELLRPGETVLAALRRLGGMQQHPSSPRAHKRAVRKSKQPQPEEAAPSGSSPQQPEQSRGEAPVSPLAGSSASALGAHAGAAGATSPAAARPSPSSSAAASTPPTPAAVVAAAAASLSADAAGAGNGERGAQGHDRRAGAGPSSGRARMSAEDSIPFDKLTEYADILLGSGDFGIYEASREQLLRQLEATSLQDSLVEDDLSNSAQQRGRRSEQKERQQQQQEPQQPTAVDADVDMFGGDEAEGGGAAAGAVRVAVDGPHAAAAASSDTLQRQAAAGVNGSGPAMGGGDAAMTDAQQEGPEVAGRQQGSHDAESGGHTAGSDRQSPGAPTAPAGAAAAGGAQGVQRAADPAAGAEGSGAQPGVQAALEGFVYDDQSGWYYNSSLGYYYSPETCLFGDSSTGQWFKWDEREGRYELAA